MYWGVASLHVHITVTRLCNKEEKPWSSLYWRHEDEGKLMLTVLWGWRLRRGSEHLVIRANCTEPVHCQLWSCPPPPPSSPTNHWQIALHSTGANKQTEGQAQTCILAKQFANLSPEYSAYRESYVVFRWSDIVNILQQCIQHLTMPQWHSKNRNLLKTEIS